MTIRVILADDHTLMRETLRMLLEAEKDIEVVGDVADGHAALKLANELKPDVVVMDVGMPDMNGIDATRRLLAENPKMRVVALSAFSSRQYVLEMFDAGATAYISKSEAAEELLHAVRAVVKNQKYLCPCITAVMEGDTTPQMVAGIKLIGRREREVLQLLAEGHSSPEIAERLFISASTVDVHRRNIMNKLGLHSIAELTKYAIRHGLTSI